MPTITESPLPQAALELLTSHGVKVTNPDIASFRAATANVHKKFEGTWKPGLYTRIVNTR